MAYLIQFQADANGIPMSQVVKDLRTTLVRLEGYVKEGMKKLGSIENLEDHDIGIPVASYSQGCFSIEGDAPWNIFELHSQYRQAMVILRSLKALSESEPFAGSVIMGMSPSQQKGLDVQGLYVKDGIEINWALEAYGGINVKNNQKALSDARNMFNIEKHGVFNRRLFCCYSAAWLYGQPTDESFFLGQRREFRFTKIRTSSNEVSVFEVQTA